MFLLTQIIVSILKKTSKLLFYKKNKILLYINWKKKLFNQSFKSFEVPQVM